VALVNNVCIKPESDHEPNQGGILLKLVLEYKSYSTAG